MMNNILAVFFGIALIGGSVLYVNLEKVEEEEQQEQQEQEQAESEAPEESLVDEEALASLVDCLKEKKVVAYGSRTCPHCLNLVESFGGYDIIDPIYVECSGGDERCQTDKQTGYVPEIQIDSELYQGERSPKAIAKVAGCDF
jgi:hypothetical protein